MVEIFLKSPNVQYPEFFSLKSVSNPFAIIFLKEVFEEIILKKIMFPFPWNPNLKTYATSLLILFLVVKDLKEREILFLTEPINQNKLSKR